MVGLIRIFVIATLWLASLPAAFAISFTYLGGNVEGVSIPSGQTGTIGADGWFVQMPTFFQLGATQKHAQVTYQVQADVGYYLTGVTLDPNGTVQGNATVNVSAVHPGSATATFQDTSVAIKQLGSTFTTMTGAQNSYTVTVDMDLTGVGSSSVSKISIMQVFYQQAPVPEPSTMLALLAGLGFIRNKKRGIIRS